MHQEVSIEQQSFHLVDKLEYSQEFTLAEKSLQGNHVKASRSGSFAWMGQEWDNSLWSFLLMDELQYLQGN